MNDIISSVFFDSLHRSLADCRLQAVGLILLCAAVTCSGGDLPGPVPAFISAAMEPRGARASDPQKTSCRAMIGLKLKKTYPEARFKFIDAAIGGTGSQLAAFRLERDVLSRSSRNPGESSHHKPHAHLLN